MKGEYVEAFKVLKRIANANKKVVPQRYELILLNNDNKQTESEDETDKKAAQV
jgi:hypothetical protein